MKRELTGVEKIMAWRQRQWREWEKHLAGRTATRQAKSPITRTPLYKVE